MPCLCACKCKGSFSSLRYRSDEPANQSHSRQAQQATRDGKSARTGYDLACSTKKLHERMYVHKGKQVIHSARDSARDSW